MYYLRGVANAFILLVVGLRFSTHARRSLDISFAIHPPLQINPSSPDPHNMIGMWPNLAMHLKPANECPAVPHCYSEYSIVADLAR